MAEQKVETFILFNEREDAVREIVEALEAKGVSTYFWRRDIEPGEKWDRIEAQKLREAHTVLVFLGNAGWGPHHLPLTQEALDLDKKVIPVLIGDPPPDSFEKAEGLFRDRRYIEVRELSPAAIEKLLHAIRRREAPRSGRVENFLRTLIDGNEGERSEAFRQIKSLNALDRRVLAARLREEITANFAPSTVTTQGSARRPKGFVSSIRSWLLSSLIYADGTSEESRALLLRHLQLSYEPERDVRFWTLAGLHQSKVPYAPEALKLAMEDSEPVVSWLARAAASPADSEVIGTFRGWIRSGDFDVAWPALRVLRVIPLPELAVDVCEALGAHEPGTSFSYDALYTLASPEMARAAAPHLVEKYGVKAIVRRVIAEAGGSNSNAPRNFALLLAALDESDVDRALEAALVDQQSRDLALRLRRHLAELRHREGAAAARYVAGFAPDTIDVSDDRLGISEDVQTLTAVMMAKEVKPPLAIGLFGDWGSGKSFFMRSMRAAAEDLAARGSSSSAFCSNIASIEFNAWHYVDTNLWASLVSYILERLDEYVRGGDGDKATESVLVKELSSAKAVLREAESEKARTEQLVSERKQELETLRVEREQREVRLSELRARDLYSMLPEEQKRRLKAALEEVGLPAALEGASDLSSVISEAHTVRGYAHALFVSLLKGQNRGIVLGLMAFVLVVPLGVYYLRPYLDSFLLIASAVFAEFVAVAAGVTRVLRKALEKANAGLKAVDSARESAEAVLAEKRRELTSEEKELQKEIASLDAEEKEATSKLSAAAARVQELEERIRSINEGRSLARFLAERASSEDYRKHLGLISTVRRDFELLGTRLAAGQNGPGGDGLKRVDRIILYIDDLDRCPADKVLDVLQAVHLLLAYPLFVVVVGVDPRWLLHSLGKQYSAFQGEGGHLSANPDVWRTTPQNYLEKIFQVSFTLRRMSARGRSRHPPRRMRDGWGWVTKTRRAAKESGRPRLRVSRPNTQREAGNLNLIPKAPKARAKPRRGGGGRNLPLATNHSL
jgi:hypothetical protein